MKLFVISIVKSKKSGRINDFIKERIGKISMLDINKGGKSSINLAKEINN